MSPHLQQLLMIEKLAELRRRAQTPTVRVAHAYSPLGLDPAARRIGLGVGEILGDEVGVTVLYPDQAGRRATSVYMGRLK